MSTDKDNIAKTQTKLSSNGLQNPKNTQNVSYQSQKQQKKNQNLLQK